MQDKIENMDDGLDGPWFNGTSKEENNLERCVQFENANNTYYISKGCTLDTDEEIEYKKAHNLRVKNNSLNESLKNTKSDPKLGSENGYRIHDPYSVLIG